MSENEKTSSGQVEPFPKPATGRDLGNQLAQLRDMLCAEFPQAEEITLSYDGHLHAHIDVRKGEEMLMVEARLASLAGGSFQQVTRGPAPHHPFLHRVSVRIEK